MLCTYKSLSHTVSGIAGTTNVYRLAGQNGEQ